MSYGGHLKRRRGWLDHLQEGRVTLLESAVHDIIGLLADKSTGILFGSARALAARCGAGDVSDRQARHLLESLEAKGYIKRFTTPRAHGNYPILVNKYEVTFGAQKGKRLNATATIDWRNPVYEPCPEHGAEEGAQYGAECASDQERESKSKKKTILSPVQKLSRSATDDSPLVLFESLKNSLPSLTHRQLEFAIERISSRAKTPPRGLGFWKKSLPLFFSADVFGGEIESFLSDDAYRFLERGEASLANVAEDLKCDAANYDLPYGSLAVSRAIESAINRREREAALRMALQIGGEAIPTAHFRTVGVVPATRAMKTA
jgi:hypothetical protein